MNKVDNGDGTTTVYNDDGSVAYKVNTSTGLSVTGAAPMPQGSQLPGQDLKPGLIPVNKNSIPNVNAMKSMLSQFSGNTDPDIVQDLLYDSQLMTTASAKGLKFFTTVSNDLSLSNVSQASTLQQEAFYGTGIRFEIFNDQANPGDYVTIKDIFRVGYFNLWIQRKIYASTYLMWFLTPAASLVVNTNYFSNDPFRTWHLAMPITLPPLIAFYGEVLFSAAVPSLTGNWYMRMIIEGFRYRIIQ